METEQKLLDEDLKDRRRDEAVTKFLFSVLYVTTAWLLVQIFAAFFILGASFR